MNDDTERKEPNEGDNYAGVKVKRYPPGHARGAFNAESWSIERLSGNCYTAYDPKRKQEKKKKKLNKRVGPKK